MKILATLSATLLSAVAFAAEPLTFQSAETPVSLLELYTSEGCSSCPPADAWVSKLKTSPALWTSVVPVVFHVDYWDRLGWPDRFASADFTARQRRYSAVWRSNSIYTPGFVLNGREWRGYFDRQPLPAAGSAKVGRLQLTLRDRTRAEVVFTPTNPTAKPQQVELAILGGELDSDVERGENGGRKLRHDFVALHLATAPLTADRNRWIASFTLPEKTVAEPVAIAVWVSGGPAQPPLQAVGGWLKRR